MQVMPDESVKLLSEGQVVAELTANPGAEIYSASGVRMKLEAGKIVGVPSEKDPLGVPGNVTIRSNFEAVTAYRRP